MSFRRANGASAKLRLLGVLALVIAPAVTAATALADPTREDRAAATALFDEGRKLAGDKKYAEACPKFEAAMRLDPGMGTLFNLSDCYEQIGRTASAWSGFRDVASQAKAAGQPDREKAARDRFAALEPKLSKVRIVVPASMAGVTMTITRDGSGVPSALVGSPIPVDPGQHTLRVVVEGKEPWETKFTVAPRGGTTDVIVPELRTTDVAPTGTGSATAPPPTGSATASAPPTASAAPSASAWVNPRPWQKPIGIAATVAGVAGLGVGVAFGFVAKSTQDESNKSDCDAKADTCKPAGLETRARAVDQGNIGTAIGIAGGVVGAAGLALWIFSPSSPSPAVGTPAPGKPAAVSNVRVVAGPTGVLVSGQF